jgi:hypothetical protein
LFHQAYSCLDTFHKTEISRNKRKISQNTKVIAKFCIPKFHIHPSHKISTVSFMPQNLIPRSHLNPWIRSQVSMTLLNPLPLSHLDYRIFYKNVQVRSRCLIETMETDPTVLLKPRKLIKGPH